MYSHTLNENGTLNSRCLYCFMTIGSAVENETELARIESEHICPEKVLASAYEASRSKQPKPLTFIHVVLQDTGAHPVQLFWCILG